MPHSLKKVIKGCLLACLHKFQLFWKQKEDGRIFKWFIDTTQKIESMYISNFEMVHITVYKRDFFKTYILQFCILQFLFINFIVLFI